MAVYDFMGHVSGISASRGYNMHRKGKVGGPERSGIANGLSNSVIGSKGVHNTKIHRCVQNQL